MTQIPHLDHPSTGLKRRTLVGAAAWSAPAIVLASAAPAYAVSTLGIISFVDADDLIGSGYTSTLTVQLTVPDGLAVPASVDVAYSVAGIVSGPTVVPTGGKTLFTFDVRGLTTAGSTEITVSAKNFVDAQTTVTVTVDNSEIVFLNAFSFGVANSLNTISRSGVGIRNTGTSGSVVDTFPGNTFLYNTTAATNTLLASGFVFQGTPAKNSPIRGKVDFTLDVFTNGGDRLIWQKGSSRPNAGKPVNGTTIIGTTARDGSMAGNSTAYAPGQPAVLPIVRETTNLGTTRPGGTLYFMFSFPRFPNYYALFDFQY